MPRLSGLSLRSMQSRLLLLVLLVLAAGVLGCAPRSAEEVAADRARALGTWEYQTDGIGVLQRGTMRITVDDGHLVGRFQDSWRGEVQARVMLQGPRMELDLDRVRITGRIERGRFRGTVHTPIWDVSQPRAQQSRSAGAFLARRVHSESLLQELTEFGCSSLLRESSYTCSPLLRR